MRWSRAFATLVVLGGCRSLLDLESPVRRTDAAVPDVSDAELDAVIPLACPTSYVSIGSSLTKYRFVSTPASWASAAATCVSDGGAMQYTHLVVIGTDAERVAVASYAAGGGFHIGLTDIATEGTFRWVTDEPTTGYPGLSTPPWASGQPSGGGDDCAYVYTTGELFDGDCAFAAVYMCECDAYPNQPANY